MQKDEVGHRHCWYLPSWRLVGMFMFCRWCCRASHLCRVSPRVASQCSQSGPCKLSNSLYKILICPQSSQNRLQSSISHHHQIPFSPWNPAEFLAQAASCKQVLLPAQTSRIPWALSILCVESGSDGHHCNNPHVIPTPFCSALFPPKPKCFLTAKVHPLSSPWGEKHCCFCSQKRSCKGREWA